MKNLVGVMNRLLRQSDHDPESPDPLGTNVASQQDDTLVPDQTRSKLTVNSDENQAPTGNHYIQYYQSSATVWALYLKETEAEDRELAQLWQTGLDQLLIFVCQISLSVPYAVLNYRRPVCSAQSSLLFSSKVART